MNKEQFKEYAELKIEEKRIKERIDELNPLLKEQIAASGADKVTTDFGNFTLGSRATWKYSEAVTKLQEEEKAKGIAKKVETTSLIYSAPKAGNQDE
jgi:hypothetical protein